MAKETRKTSFTNAMIDVSEMTISEFDKDGNPVTYDLTKILGEYNCIPGVSLSLSMSGEINGEYPDETEE